MAPTPRHFTLLTNYKLNEHVQTMKKTIYISPQIYVVKLRQQPLMQYVSPATPPKKNDDSSDTGWTENGDYNL